MEDAATRLHGGVLPPATTDSISASVTSEGTQIFKHIPGEHISPLVLGLLVFVFALVSCGIILI